MFGLIIAGSLGTQRKPIGSSMVNHQIGRRNQEENDEYFRHLILKIKSRKIPQLSPFTKEKLEYLYKFFSSKMSVNTPSSLAQKGTHFSIALLSTKF